MRVKPIASTVLAAEVFGSLAIQEEMTPDVQARDADTLAEFAGRACYQSFDKPNPKTARNKDYLANILRQSHESVLEHANVTFYVTGVSRALTHELIRHRHLSFSELSQRFVDVSHVEFVLPPALRDGQPDMKDEVGGYFYGAVHGYDFVNKFLSKVRGLPRKQAREAARAVMPNATETRIVVTGNMRAWRDVLKKRWSTHADAEIREFAGEVLSHLRRIAPNTFADIPEQPYE